VFREENVMSMTVEDFGRKLITSKDLDPVYVMLVRSGLPTGLLEKWCLAYWCFYNVGVASFMAEAPIEDFWDLMYEAADNDESLRGFRWPRGTERRHFRGVQATNAITELMEHYPIPNEVFLEFQSLNLLTYASISRIAQGWRGFGPWISFKVVDMLDRVMFYDIDWSDCNLDFYTDPLKGGTAVVHALEYGSPDGWRPQFDELSLQGRQANLAKAVDYLKDQFKDLKAPPSDDRPIDIPEIETVLCKWKSHLNGHYPMGKDTKEFVETLHSGPFNVGGEDSWGDLAVELRKYLPGEGN
jgi:hypothetical protein